ncbi:PAP2-domain-containing protein [Athelia psychrophila]|uniref:PAP2-domain-containing protein n=1 Tax=Athelia psychrophila TaxID=1759441 RepID=A0A166HXR8_9AGAM|nr:PAP2-domain-containing protein [Fibularhizoctonia sp. CBS 109695]
MSGGPTASLDLTHVLYDDTSHLSLGLALITLSPILLMASYAALAVQTREITIITMWAGQLACEGFNWILKRAIKQERPVESLGNGYGFPSSHSQYMGYFAAFLFCHMYFRHRFESSGYPMLDAAWRGLVYTAIGAWSLAVPYSRYHLQYHTPFQILCGYFIGVFLGLALYLVAEYIPRYHPQSLLGRLKGGVLCGQVATWCRIRDGWGVWADGGREQEWVRWRAEWETQQATHLKDKKQ